MLLVLKKLPPRGRSKCSQDGKRLFSFKAGSDPASGFFGSGLFFTCGRWSKCSSLIILKTAVEAGKKAQSFDPESLDAGVAFTSWGCSTPASRDSGSKDCAFLHDSTAFFRIMMGFFLSLEGSGAVYYWQEGRPQARLRQGWDGHGSYQ